jgi:hypothetical protein
LSTSLPSVTARSALAVGYFGKDLVDHLNALSAAACGVFPTVMMSAQAWPQTCWFWTSAQAGLKHEKNGRLGQQTFAD